MTKTIITSALPYVNNVPHLGNLICVLSADVYSKYLELQKREKIFVLGTDEHGTTSEQKAKEENTTPRKLVDKYFKIHTDSYNWFSIKPDCYGRTSDEENHLTTKEIFTDLDKNGYIDEKEIEQAYDPKEKKFLADRFVEGTCPYCKYEDARGDQCDNCQKLLSPEELKNPRSALSDAKIEFKKSIHLFLDLPKIQPLLEEWVNAVKDSWTENARTATLGFFKEGLISRAITRDLKWGVKVNKKGFEGKVFYSWFDAPIGYIGITRKARKDWKDWWQNPNTELVQFMGKDNTIFHTIMFPGYLLGTGKKWSLVKKLSVNEYLNYETGKFSKSRNIGVFCDNAKNSGVNADSYRYYLTINRPESSDTVFDWDDFQEKINNDLVGNFGNLVNRTLTFIERECNNKVGKADLELDLKNDLDNIEQLYENIELRAVTKALMQASSKVNKYFQDKAPWQIKDKKELDRVMANLANAVKDLSIALWPIIPESSENIWKFFGLKAQSWNDIGKVQELKLKERGLLFKKLEEKEKIELRKQFGEADPFEKVDLRVAQIKEIKPHPDADKLYVLQLDVGEEKKQIVAGLKAHYSEKELLNKKIIIVNNLEPAKLRGETSNGMLLAVENKGTVKVLSPDAKPGTQITVDGVLNNPEKKISIEHFMSLKLKVESGKAKYKNRTLLANKKPVTSELPQGKIR